MLCKVIVKPPVTEPGMRDWEEVVVRMRALLKLERVWRKSAGAAKGSLSDLSTAKEVGMSSSELSASEEERERKLFCQALGDGVVLCQCVLSLFL